MTKSEIHTIPAPTQGWVTNTPSGFGEPSTARILDNFFPAPDGVSPRGGTRLRVSVPGSIISIFEYNYDGKKRYFVATETSIFGFDDDTEEGILLSEADVGDLTSGNFSVSTLGNRGGTFITLFNGANSAQIYDGADWSVVDSYNIVDAEGDASGILLSNTVNFSWVYDNRLILLENNGLNAYALTVGKTTGDAIQIPSLNSIFNRASYLVSGGVWSGDSGSGISDRCIFIADSGEVAVCTGDPDVIVGPNAWQLVGVFDIGRPVSKLGSFRIGGDWCVATDSGIIPMQAVLGRDVAALSVVSLTRPIEDEWKAAIRQTSPTQKERWQMVRWAAGDMLLVSPPTLSADDNSFVFVANTKNNAWCKFTGWDVNAFGVLGGLLFYGSHSGQLFQCDHGGTDNGNPFVCRLCTEFTACGSFGTYKVVGGVRDTWKYNSPVPIIASVAVNHNTFFYDEPVIGRFVTHAPLWDLASWDEVEWAGESADNYRSNWRVVSGHGSWLAYQAQLASNHGERVDCTLLSIEVSYMTGGAFS